MKRETAAQLISKAIIKTGRVFLFQDKQSALGNAFKKARLKKNLTQQEFAKGICSYSYESKIEANKIIPNNNCVYMLCEKHGINKDEIYIIENSNDLLKESYDCYFKEDIQGYTDLFNRVKDIEENQFSDTIKLGYYILTSNMVEAEKIVQAYFNTISTFTNTSLYMFSLYTSEYLYRDYDYAEADKIIEELIKNDVDDIFTLMAKELLFKICIALNKTAPGIEIYRDIHRRYTNMSMYEKLDELKLGYLELLFNSEDYNYFLIVSSEYSFKENLKNIDKYYYMKGISYFKNNEYSKANECFEKIPINSKYKAMIVNEREFLYAGSKKNFLDSIKKENKENPSFYLMYYIYQRSSNNDKSIFKNHEYLTLYRNSSIVEKINLLKLEAKEARLNFKYKEAVSIDLKIEELRSKKL